MSYVARSAFLLLTLGVAFLSPLACGRAAAQARVNVTVNAGATIGPLPDTAYGVNVSVGDDAMSDAGLPAKLSQVGIGVLRFPGGATADDYHWRTNSATPGTDPVIAPRDTFDAFMAVARQVRATPLLTVNYGTNAAGTGGGDPAEAAAWVNYANKVKDYGANYWEIGDEVYGNGAYGARWDRDMHRDHSPTAYGQNAVQFITAMKAVDPHIKVGVGLVAPGVWPDGQSPDWDSAVLAQCGGRIDFVSVHWYPEAPGGQDDAGLLSSTARIPGMVAKLRALITHYCGANAQAVQIFVTRTDPVSYNPSPQSIGLVSALFLADDYLTWLENGAANVDWWELHGGPFGKGDYGDLGLFATGRAPEPPVDTPFPAYYGLEMLAGLGRPGDRMVSATSGRPLVSAHAVLRADGSLGVMLINKDPLRSYAVRVKVSGYRPARQAGAYVYGQGSRSVVPSVIPAGQTLTRTVAPYSLNVIVLEPYVAPQPRPRARPRSDRAPYRIILPRPRRLRTPVYLLP